MPNEPEAREALRKAAFQWDNARRATMLPIRENICYDHEKLVALMRERGRKYLAMEEALYQWLEF